MEIQMEQGSNQVNVVGTIWFLLEPRFGNRAHTTRGSGASGQGSPCCNHLRVAPGREIDALATIGSSAGAGAILLSQFWGWPLFRFSYGRCQRPIPSADRNLWFCNFEFVLVKSLFHVFVFVPVFCMVLPIFFVLRPPNPRPSVFESTLLPLRLPSCYIATFKTLL